MASQAAKDWPVIGHEEVRALLGRLSAQTLLFTGPEGVGRRRVARWLAEEGGWEYLEVSPLERARPEIVSEQVEALREWLSTLPRQGFKLGVLDGAHLLTERAANALLKLLEDPPSYARLVLIAPSREGILPTLSSRAVEIPFRPVPEEVLRSLTEDPLLLRYAQGAPGRLLRALEDPSRIHGLFALAKKAAAPGAFERHQALKALFQEAGAEGLFFLGLALGPHPALLQAQKALEAYVNQDLLLAWLALKLGA